ncbi:hypothetical protein PFISCL1PPCAC_15303 [Pristionchus fissidentatus]|uniref:Amine oxidase domain-containing protein n=1 Tax=Pristionchus fissidentatus TaxID=1538716 RepID=A0AAV5VZT0_9BILA|nr:hypothetical protein PFISCL1PPCAC_15303 [Pristionchus fissidentatus]
MKIVCIGTAVTGLGAAYRLNELIGEGNEEAKNTEIIFLERESLAGGLSCTITDKEGFLWDMGGHVTFHHNQPYYEKATKWAVADWNDIARNCQVDMNYAYKEEGIHLVPYPAQFAVPLFPQKTKDACVAELKERYDNPPSADSVPANFDEWIENNFGPTINKTFFHPYTRKVWTVETKQMSHLWVGTRVAKLPQEKLEELCAMTPEELEIADFGWGPNAEFCFPKRGGTGNVWTSMAAKLPQQWFKYNSNVLRVDHLEKKVVYSDKEGNEHEEKYDALLSTSPIDLLIKETQLTTPLNIMYNKVFVVGVGLRKPMTPFLEPITWLYFPDKNVPFFRVTILSSYGEMTPHSDKYWSVMCECARPIDDTDSEEEVTRQAVEGLLYKTMITKEAIASVWSITLPYGYPIPTVERDSELARAHKELEKHSIYSRGRFGGWKYEVSNQDHCFMQGKEFVDRMLFNEPEKMYKTGIIESKQG